jgi:FkbM family methyltransferase
MYSQLGQDNFVLHRIGKTGFFVEVGAGHPENFSNSLLLEQSGWTGICVDPLLDDEAYDKFKRTCIQDKRAVFTHSGTVKFRCVPDSGGVLSTIVDYVDTPDVHKSVRQHGRDIEIPCVTLHGLLAEHNAPAYVDYLSIDTEGSELDILKAYNWSRYFGIITVEHNERQDYLEEITTFLREYGYTWRKVVEWDVWFVHKNLEKVS